MHVVLLIIIYKACNVNLSTWEGTRAQLEYIIYIFICLKIFNQFSENEKWWETAPLKRTVETVVDATPLDVEITGYGLLIYVHRTLTQDAIPIMRWLTRQRNQHGGFQSTQVR